MARTTFQTRCYDLGATLDSGQAFRWELRDNGWEGLLANRWVRLRQEREAIIAETVADPADWRWLTDYLQIDVDLEAIIATFPKDEPMQRAVASSRGLRLLRQDPWECLASFILSSTKQIVQIKQIVAALCSRFGESVAVPGGHAPAFSFPTAARIAQCTERELRDCKMGFRAPYLLGSARLIHEGAIDLQNLGRDVTAGREQLIRLPGVGRKIADCVLLFAYGFQEAFPVDVWVMKALQQLYFPKRRVSLKRLRHFSETHFGPNAGYAQQYLFHYMRTKHDLP